MTVLLPIWCAAGVGNNPHPIPPVRGAHGRSRYAVPLRVIPARGQVPEYAAHDCSSVRAKHPWYVLHESGSHLANDPPEVGPKITLVGGPSALAGEAVWLARDATKDEIHKSMPGSPVKGLEVIPDGSGAQPPILHALSQQPLAVGVSLNVADSSTEPDGFEGCRADPTSGTNVQAIEHQNLPNVSR
jgi:hypothetical protein